MLKWAVSKEGRGLAILSYSTSQGLRGEALMGTDVEVWPLCALTPDRAAWGCRRECGEDHRSAQWVPEKTILFNLLTPEI